MDEKNKRVIIVSIVALAIVLITASYAYFSARITGLENASTISMSAGTLGIHYAEGDENVTVSNIYPREEAWVTKTFTLIGNNTTDLEMKYTLGLNVEANTFPDNYLTYDLKVLEQTGGTPVTEKTNAPINGTGLKKFGNGTFVTGQNKTHKYELKIYFKDNGLDQNDAQGAIFNAKINVSEYTPKKGYVYKQNIVSYDINRNNCNEYYSNQGAKEEAQNTICSGNEFILNRWSLAQDIEDGNNTITSYTINEQNCKDLLSGWDYTGDDQQTFCSGEEVVESISIAKQIEEGKEQELINNNVIENVQYSDPILATSLNPGDKYVDGQYTYVYRQERVIHYKQGTNRVPMSYSIRTIEEDGWGVYLTDENSTDPVTTELCSNINGEPIISMAGMFFNSHATSIDLSSFDTSNVINMEAMFARSQATSIDLSSFNTSNVKNMRYMFFSSPTNSLDLGGFITSQVTDMSGMFAYSEITNLDLSNFDTSNVTNMQSMFSNASNLTTIYVSNDFTTVNVTANNSYNMFGGATNLVGGAGTIYNSSKVDKEYAHIDGGSSNPGYFTSK